MNAAGLMPVDQALDYLLSNVSLVDQTEDVDLNSALGRVLAEPVVSVVNVPPYDNSAVDGYVIGNDSVDSKDALELSVSQRIPAGIVPSRLKAGSAARIFTGAEIPEGGLAVVMQEDCEIADHQVVVPAGISAGQNVRKCGQDIRSGEVVLNVGHLLQAQDVGLLASIGVAKVRCFRRLKVAVISTGDELIEPGEAPAPGKIYNSNRYTLVSLLQRLGCEIIDLGIVPDQLDATLDALSSASREADLILSSGGVSVGEEDHVKVAVQQLGALDLWRLAIKPGKPLAYGNVSGTPFLGLPGNPSAVFVTFAIIARPYIEKAQGRRSRESARMKVPVGFSVKKAGIRQEYLRVRLIEKEGQLILDKFPNQSSGVLSSASWADGFAVIPAGKTLEEGDLAEYLSFAGLGI
ncbi:gephyrin-like molybdotransferase Glp [Hahella ganghwensis]|uniref:molybdopterin molybdotransferase MoeA n=1 Tax=Hahella ganghwensis TaxID=286420 RepID=UPI0003792114|nr:gephyrin-like molybdotransferase Glp [Hahella ganghwensis]